MGKLLEALSKAQLEFKPIKKTGKNPFLHNDYATLDDIVNATKDGLSNNGLSIIHRKDKGSSEFITELWHFEEEEPMATYTDMEQFTKTSEKTSLIQIYGGIITYLRRYHTGMLLNLCVEEDIDGNDGKSGDKATTQPKPNTTKPVTQAKVEPPDTKMVDDSEVDPVFAQFKADIERIDNISHLKNWKEANTGALDGMKDSPEKDELRNLYSAKMKDLKAQYAKQQADKPIEDDSLLPPEVEEKHNPGI